MRAKKTMWMLVAGVVAAVSAVTGAKAQTGGLFDLSWNTIDGGGGKSTGGAFAVEGTIGQPDAGSMAGGQFSISGGFWAAAPACPTGCTPADVATEGSSDPLAGPDGFVTGVDFDVYVQAYFQELRRPCDNKLIADLTDGLGTGGPDGFLTGTDFDYFILDYFEGC